MNKAFLQRLRAPAALSALLAVLAGVAGIVGARHYLTAQAQALQREFSERYATRSVVVAARDLLRGERLEAGSMAVRLMPARFLPSGSLGPEHASGVGGRRLERNLKRGDPILADALASSAPSTLARKLRPGLRAITFVVDEVNSFANLLNAGDVIDLYYSHDAAGQTSALSLLLETVPVLATGQRLVEATEASSATRAAGFGSITLEVTPDDAARIVLAQRTGQVTAVLRHPGDSGPASIVATSSRMLLSASRAAAVHGRSADAGAFVHLIVGGNGGPVPRMDQLRVGMPAAAAAGIAK